MDTREYNVLFKRGDIVQLRKPVQHPTQMYLVSSKINCEILDILDHVVMLCPHNSGHEFITCLDNIKMEVLRDTN